MKLSLIDYSTDLTTLTLVGTHQQASDRRVRRVVFFFYFLGYYRLNIYGDVVIMFTNGRFFLVLGIIFLLIGFFTNTTVSTSLGEVHNLGLMNEKQNYIILGGFLLLAGVILQSKSSRKSDIEEDVKKDSTDKQKGIPPKALGIKSFSTLSHKKLRIEASLLFSFVTSIFVVILFLFIGFTLVFFTSLIFTLILSLSYSFLLSDGIKSSINIIKYTRYSAYIFISICTIWLLSVWLYYFGLLSIERSSFLAFYIESSVKRIEAAMIYSAFIVILIGLSLIPINITNKWLKKLE